MFQSIKIISFESDYEFQTDNIIQNDQTPYQELKLCQKKQNLAKQYLAAYYEIPQNDQQKIIQMFYKVKSLKIFHLIKEESFYFELDRFIIVYPYLQEYQLTQELLRKLNRNQKKKILLELTITLHELIQRKIPVKLKENLEQLYFIDDHIFINMMKFDYYTVETDSSSLYSLKKIINMNFNFTELPELQDIDLKVNTFNSFTEQIITVYGLNRQDPNQAQYFEVFKYLFNIVDFKQLAAFNANSYIYKIEKPLVLEKIISTPITSNIVAKSTKLEGENIEDIKVNAQREIELMEKFETNQKFASCFKYIRILDQSYLFLQFYCKNLREYFELIKQNPKKYFNNLIVYKISYQFIQGIVYLHMAGIKHRDLKPENLFLTDTNLLQKGDIHIADFDRSKQQLEPQQNKQIFITQINSDNTPEYSPPEGTQNQDHTIDIWQFGLIIYEVANMGVYPGKAIVLDFEKLYGHQVIETKLAKHNYDKKFLDIIKSCLSEDPNQRPQAKDIEDQLRNIYQMELQLELKKPIGPKIFRNFTPQSPLQPNHQQQDVEFSQ